MDGQQRLQNLSLGAMNLCIVMGFTKIDHAVSGQNRRQLGGLQRQPGGDVQQGLSGGRSAQ